MDSASSIDSNFLVNNWWFKMVGDKAPFFPCPAPSDGFELVDEPKVQLVRRAKNNLAFGVACLSFLLLFSPIVNKSIALWLGVGVSIFSVIPGGYHTWGGNPSSNNETQQVDK